MMKRQRGRGRKPGGGGGGGHQPNRTLESTGPDVKIRGSAAHIYDKYMQLSRDASSAGDRVASESYLQHAEHYYRMLRAMQPQQMPVLDQRFNNDFDYEDEGGEAEETAEGAEAPEGVEAEAGGEQPYIQREQRPDRQQDRQGGDRPRQNYRDQQGGYNGGQAPRTEGQFGEDGAPVQGGEQDGFRNNRRRRNRGRYRPDGDRGPDNRGPEGGGNDQGPVEGFGETIPAFVGGE